LSERKGAEQQKYDRSQSGQAGIRPVRWRGSSGGHMGERGQVEIMSGVLDIAQHTIEFDQH